MLDGIILTMNGRKYEIIRIEGEEEKPWPEGTSEIQKQLFNPPSDAILRCFDVETGELCYVHIDRATFNQKAHECIIKSLSDNSSILIESVDVKFTPITPLDFG